MDEPFNHGFCIFGGYVNITDHQQNYFALIAKFSHVIFVENNWSTAANKVNSDIKNAQVAKNHKIIIFGRLLGCKVSLMRIVRSSAQQSIKNTLIATVIFLMRLSDVG